jgi:precorrin-8X/cobalt-precorrin-8 methylmutase
MALFDRILIVDWSGAGVPVKGANSIWACLVRRSGDQVHLDWLENFATRHAFMQRLGVVVDEALAAGERLLCGFDFAFGFPAGTAERLTGRADWRSLWRKIAEDIEDGADNANNRFQLASNWNRDYFADAPRFWGRPQGHSYTHLSDRKPVGPVDAPRVFRVAEAHAKGAKSVWQLAYAGSVGSQSLLGIARLSRFIDDSGFADRIAVWPFETGFSAEFSKSIVFAEIYPSLFSLPDGAEGVRDALQVSTVAEAFSRFDSAGVLEHLFAAPDMLSAVEQDQVVREEGWVLGIGHQALVAQGVPPLWPAGHLPHKGGDQGAADLGTAKSFAGPEYEAVATSSSLARPAISPLVGEMSRSDRGGYSPSATLDYIRDPAEIYRQSFSTIRDEVNLSRFSNGLDALVIRLIHACGMVDLVDDIAFSDGAFDAGVAALAGSAPVLVDVEMVRHGIIRRLLPADNEVICLLNDARVRPKAEEIGNTRSAAQVDLWDEHLAGAVVAIGNAPTALFRLLERIDAGAPKPALILGMPVGFVGAAESKDALIADSRGIPYIAVRGRRGGSAMASAAVNALAGGLGTNV